MSMTDKMTNKEDGTLSTMSVNSSSLPSVQLTQQDFVSTFPWGIRGDKVRILQQEVENEILDTETIAAMAFMLGFESSSEQLDEVWKTLLNSQNHDVHVCLFDEVGIDWCYEAREAAAKVRQKASEFIANRVGGPAVALNTLSWNRPLKTSITEVPAFGYTILDEANTLEVPEYDKSMPWDGWFKTKKYSLRMRQDGCLESRIGSDIKSLALIGNLTVYSEGKMLDSRSAILSKTDAWLSSDKKIAYARLEGRIGEVDFIHKVVASDEVIDMETTFDYGQGCIFGPDIKDFEKEPRRTHYFQHERKLCMNWQLPGAKTELLYNSPFLTWPVEENICSIESLHYTTLQAEGYGIAHFNIGQSGYGYMEKDSACRHVLAFSPTDYIYGEADKLLLKGKQTHRYAFMPYMGDWRQAKIPLHASSFQRPIITMQSDNKRTTLPKKASLVGIDSNTTMATALFERSGRLFIRVAEWAGQEDSVTVKFGDGKNKLMECTHGLRQIADMTNTFMLRPWEIKTIELIGTVIPFEESFLCSRSKVLKAIPEGWQLKNQFKAPISVEESTMKKDKDSILYFSSGYHDGFVRPLQRHTKTMEIEMQRSKMSEYPNYASFWEVGGSCWAAMNKNEPEYLESLKPYMKEGKIEIVGGTWCEPLSLIVSGESNIRQFLYGMEAIKEHLDLDVSIYCNQEHGTFAQMPQILRSFGIKAVVNRTQWAPYGYESGLDTEVAEWMGIEGTKIFLVPRYNSMDYNNCPWDDRNLQNGSVTGHNRVWRTREKFDEMLDRAIQYGVNKPLMTMLEDIWEESLRTTDEEMDFYASLPNVRFISLASYLQMFGV